MRSVISGILSGCSDLAGRRCSFRAPCGLFHTPAAVESCRKTAKKRENGLRISQTAYHAVCFSTRFSTGCGKVLPSCVGNGKENVGLRRGGLPRLAAVVPGGGRGGFGRLLALPEPSPAGEGQGSTPKAGVGRRQRGKTSPCSCALQKNFQKPLTEAAQYDIIAKRCQDSGKGHGGVAQLARATGSYPVGHRFKSGLRYHIGQGSAVPYPSGTALVRGFPPGPLVKRPKTPPFHGGNSSSNLLRVTK